MKSLSCYDTQMPLDPGVVISDSCKGEKICLKISIRQVETCVILNDFLKFSVTLRLEKNSFTC